MKSYSFKVFGCFVLLFFVFSFFAVDNAYASYQKVAPGDTVTLGEFVFTDDFVPTTTPCTISITNPLNVGVVPPTTMTANADGWHYYNYTTPGDADPGTWPSMMVCGSAVNGDLVKMDKSFIVDPSVLSTSTTFQEVVDNGLTTVPASVWSYSGRTLTSFGTLVSDTATAVWASGTRTLTGFGTLAADVWTNGVRTLTDATLSSGSLATQSSINTATSTLTAEIAKGWKVTLSDFGETTVNTAYKAKLQVLNYATIPTDADSLPTVVITDPAGTVQVPAGVMTKDSNGTYSYSYSIGSSAIGGVWETVVSVVINGETVKVNDYWNLSSSPADVNITEMTDRTIPTITASVRINNMGTAASDFYYVYCIVSSEENLCGGNDDIDSGSDTAFINAGGLINLSLTLDEVPTAGTYWFKVRARALAETNWAASTEQFVAESATITPPSGGGGGGGGGGGTIPSPLLPDSGLTCSGADFNRDSKVNSIDFSILLAFWQKLPPFGNPCVDINKDNKVNSVDFSILLYQWKK